MKKIRIKGTGQLNGSVIIDKEIELEDKIAKSLYGPKKDEVITSIIAVQYPGVKINPRQIGIEQIEKKSSVKKNKNNSTKKKSSTPLIFLPFKIIWRILKWLTKD